MEGDMFERFSSREYTNWFKACCCLKLLKGGLRPFITYQMKCFHAELRSQNCRLREPCRAFCRSTGTTLASPCRLCLEWKKVILSHHRQQDNVTIHWGNCFPPRWRTEYWEVAKAYMPRGYSKVKTGEEFDATALLNLINFCDCFHSVDVDYVREVIHYRNTLMHSAEFCVEDGWMQQYRRSLRSLVQQFSHVPEMLRAGAEMEKMLAAELSVCFTDGVERDSAGQPIIYPQGPSTVVPQGPSELELGVGLICQWETEFFQERLQELLHAAAEDQDESETQDAECLRTLASFLHAHRDLSERFHAELQVIDSMEVGKGKAEKKLKNV